MLARLDLSSPTARSALNLNTIYRFAYFYSFNLAQLKCAGGVYRCWASSRESVFAFSEPSIVLAVERPPKRFIFMTAVELTLECRANWSETAEQLTRLCLPRWNGFMIHFMAAYWRWHINELCRGMVQHSWLIHFPLWCLRMQDDSGSICPSRSPERETFQPIHSPNASSELSQQAKLILQYQQWIIIQIKVLSAKLKTLNCRGLWRMQERSTL